MRASLLALLVALPIPAEAQVQSSGGYRRPSAAAPRVRTPDPMSFRRPSSPSPSPAPSAGSSYSSTSTSGYARPRVRTPSVLPPSSSPGDLAVSRRISEDALRDLRRRQDAARQEADRQAAARREASRPSVTDDAPAWGERRRTPDVSRRRYDPEPETGAQPDPEPYRIPYPRRRRYEERDTADAAPPPPRRTPPVRPRWSGDPSWIAPAWADPAVDAGAWNPVMLWYFLDTLGLPGHAEWFGRHRTDPGYLSWRRAADASAPANPLLATRLADLDRGISTAQAAPDPDYLPPGVSRDEAVRGSSGLGTVLFLLLLVALLAAGAWLLLRRRGRSRMAPSSLDNLATVAGGVARRAAGKPETPREPFRLGQVVRIDEAPYLLGGKALSGKAQPGGPATVTAIGHLDGLPLTRLYLGDDRFLQVSLSADGRVDECRQFALLDVEAPTTADAWAFWLPPGAPPEAGAANEWSIGYPQFDTKDGRRWERVWSPGDDLIEPVRVTERRVSASGTRTMLQHTMLYARATDVAAPGPDREYLLLVAEEGAGGRGILIYAGLDLDVAGMNLTA